ATYHRDATNLDYADQRYYQSAWGRFTSPDPSEPGKVEEPGSWNFYAYVQNDPINFYDPEGLDVQSIPLTLGPNPTCWNRFYEEFLGGPYRGKGDNRHDKWFNSDVGTMALHVFFEFEAPETAANRVIWRSISHTIRNRWNLENEDKRDVGITTKGFKPLIYQLGGSEAKGKEAIWDNKGRLEKGRRNRLAQYLNGDPNSAMCNGILAAFDEAWSTYNNYGTSPTGDSLFYASGSATPSINSRYWVLLPPTILYGTDIRGNRITFRFWELGRRMP
ncbi:MAG: RHS repeat-associated core domain-containing protein, partial [Planctomycetota bacterium]